MSLVKCIECGRDLSSYAEKCPSCGCPNFLYEEPDLSFDPELKELLKDKPINNEYENKVKCPKCKSTSISTTARGFSIWTGFWGADRTVNRCAKCGYTWKP